MRWTLVAYYELYTSVCSLLVIEAYDKRWMFISFVIVILVIVNFFLRKWFCLSRRCCCLQNRYKQHRFRCCSVRSVNYYIQFFWLLDSLALWMTIVFKSITFLFHLSFSLLNPKTTTQIPLYMKEHTRPAKILTILYFIVELMRGAK